MFLRHVSEAVFKLRHDHRTSKLFKSGWCLDAWASSVRVVVVDVRSRDTTSPIRRPLCGTAR